MPNNRKVRRGMDDKQRRSVAAYIEVEMLKRGLSQRDLIPIIGSRSKVSEILSGTRDITMPIARALYKHLGIPSDVLLQEPPDVDATVESLDWSKFPLREMINRKWIADDSNPGKNAEKIVTPLRSSAGITDSVSMFRKNDQNRVNAKTNPYALLAWQWRVRGLAMELPISAKYSDGIVSAEFMTKVAKLSPPSDGPIRAVAFLKAHGIPVIYVPHLSRTHLDAAALSINNRPVIGLTLRYDRTDNFWFTLMHELAHIARHSEFLADGFAEDLSMNVGKNHMEQEADTLATDALIPPDAWESSSVIDTPTPIAVMELAQELGIHPAIVAGRVRHERKNYRLLSQIVGGGTVKKQFN